MREQTLPTAAASAAPLQRGTDMTKTGRTRPSARRWVSEVAMLMFALAAVIAAMASLLTAAHGG